MREKQPAGDSIAALAGWAAFDNLEFAVTTGDRRDCEHAGTCGRGLDDATATVRGKFGREVGDGFDQVRDAADHGIGALTDLL
jgi:hypothetical protein